MFDIVQSLLPHLPAFPPPPASSSMSATAPRLFPSTGMETDAETETKPQTAAAETAWQRFQTLCKVCLVLFFVAATVANLYCMLQFRHGFQSAMQTIAEARRFISVIRSFMCTREHLLTPDECAHF